MDPYQILGVSHDATAEEISAAYRDLIGSGRADSFDLTYRRRQAAYEQIMRDLDRRAGIVHPVDELRAKSRMEYYRGLHDALLQKIKEPPPSSDSSRSPRPAGLMPVSLRPLNERKHSRVAVEGQVLLTPEGGEPTVVQLRDISVEGLCVTPEKPLEVGQWCNVQMELPNETRLEFNIQVRRVDERDGAVGMHICEIDWESLQGLQDLIETAKFARTTGVGGVEIKVDHPSQSEINEQRQHPRLKLDCPVLLTSGDGRSQLAKLRDVSMGGLCIVPDSPLVVGERHTVTLQLTFGASVQFEADIVRENEADGSVGMHICQIEWDNLRSLQRILDAVSMTRGYS